MEFTFEVTQEARIYKLFTILSHLKVEWFKKFTIFQSIELLLDVVSLFFSKKP
jgi:hypothetical protein